MADQLDLAQLVRDASPQFAAIRMDPVDLATRLEQTGKQLQEGLSQEEAQKSLSNTKELRDRFYTLCLEPLREMRAFADFAFRKDRSNNRRFAYTSAYKRRINRKTLRNRAAAAVAAASTASSGDAG